MLNAKLERHVAGPHTLCMRSLLNNFQLTSKSFISKSSVSENFKVFKLQHTFKKLEFTLIDKKIALS